MKLHFEPNLDFQLEAIEAVCGLGWLYLGTREGRGKGCGKRKVKNIKAVIRVSCLVIRENHWWRLGSPQKEMSDGWRTVKAVLPARAACGSP